MDDVPSTASRSVIFIMFYFEESKMEKLKWNMKKS